MLIRGAEAYHDKQKERRVSELESSAGNTSDRINHVLYEADGGDPQDPMGRAFAVTGDVSLEMLGRTIAYLRTTGLFRIINQSGIISRITLRDGMGWNTPLQFPKGPPPRNIIAAQEKLGEQGDITVLAYIIAMLCDGLGWDAADVHIEEQPIG